MQKLINLQETPGTLITKKLVVQFWRTSTSLQITVSVHKSCNFYLCAFPSGKVTLVRDAAEQAQEERVLYSPEYFDMVTKLVK